jgi:putative oxygen-independent coproporphyrinogen III oxidase
VPAALPDGEPVPDDGGLPAAALESLASRPFGMYVHVPFCAARCGYCDFNTYTATELGGGASQAAYAETALAEVRLARRVLGEVDVPVQTVFFGGGTPTLLPAEDLGRILAAIAADFGLAADAEVSCEANPESVDRAYLHRLRAQGVNRLSLGMQSAVPHVLAVLDRRHTPGRAVAAVGWARTAGFAAVSLDLIYGAPGERPGDWQASLDAALATRPDHVSAYALVVEDGTRLAQRVARGEIKPPADDDLADCYERADDVLSAAGLSWYEISNWALPGHAGRHNLGYWQGGNWWGVGPGAHSGIGGVRWWNRRHPAGYANRLAAGRSPALGREILTASQRQTERLMLGLRLAAGLPLSELPAPAVTALLEEGLLARAAAAEERAVLTRRGRLLADGVVRRLLD